MGSKHDEMVDREVEEANRGLAARMGHETGPVMRGMQTHPAPTFRCPACKRDDMLWVGVTLLDCWQSVNARLEPVDKLETNGGFREFDGTVGCSACSWLGRRDRLERVDSRGEPMKEPIEGQTSLREEAAELRDELDKTNVDALKAVAEGEEVFDVPRSNELHTPLPDDEED